MKNIWVITSITLSSLILQGCFSIRGVEVASDQVALSYSGANGTTGLFNTTMSIAPTTLTDAGAPIINCATKPSTTALPAWATINPTTCVISGTPNATLPSTTYTLVTTNSAGQSKDATVTLSVDAAPPTLSFSGATGTSGHFGTAVSVSPTTLTANGAAINHCTITPALPAWATINATTCVISGTPNAALSSTTYTVRAVNSAGNSSAATVTLSEAAIVPSISFTGATGTTGTYGVAMTVNPVSLLSNGAAITNCAIMPALPAWATINSTTCVISGTPNATLNSTIYAVTATNSAGTSTASTVTLAVTDTAPVAAAISPAAFNQDTATTITLPYSDAENSLATSCTISALSHVAVTTACSCSAGVCTVGITSTIYYAGSGSFNFTVTENGLTSNAATATLSITSTAFKSVWRTTAANETITLPLVNGFTYNAVVDWGDGTATSTILAYNSANRIHTYATAGDYTVTVNGNFQAFSFQYGGDNLKLISIPNLGKVGWKSFIYAFYNCSNLTTVSGGDVSQVTDMTGMFLSATNAVPDTSTWNTANVIHMASMFSFATKANPNTSNWNTANATLMNNMFYGATLANPNTTNWNTSNVTNMSVMFYDAINAAPDTTNWDTINVTNMYAMFYDASKANPVTTNWNTSNVTNMGAMFANAPLANPNTSNWNTAKVTTTYWMFLGATAANPNTSNWNTNNVTDMSRMFFNAPAANPTTTNWNTSNVTDMSQMFYLALLANPNTSNWNTANVTNMVQMFLQAPIATPNTTNWKTSNVTNMSGMFWNATASNPDTSGWNTSNVTNMSVMFAGAPHANPNTTNWNTSKVTDMSTMFYVASIANPDTSNWNTSNVTSMSDMFRRASAATPNTTNWNTNNVTNMNNMFMDATIANPITTNWNTSNVTNMAGMFSGENYGVTALNPDVSNWNTSNVTNMSNMFAVSPQANPNVTNWNTSNVTNMSLMFYLASRAIPNTSNWNTSNVTSMYAMFQSATAANPNVTNWNTAKVTDMFRLFYGATNANPNVTNWNTSNVTTMVGIFYSATNANPDLSHWDISKQIGSSMQHIFWQSNISTTNYSNSLINFANQAGSPSNIDLGWLSAKYSIGAATTARATLLSKGWTISDGGQAP